MIIGLVRESVLQCFCHTCRAPLPLAVHRSQVPITKVKTKPRTATIALQPKRVQFVTTEVRCQEKTRGGLRYEVILGEPEVKANPPKKQVSPKNSMSVQDIEEKLKAAEERRQQLESSKMAALSAKILKIEEASRKKDEQTTQFISSTRDALEQKMGLHVEKREAYITDLRSKLKDHIENVEKTRLSLEQQTEEVRTQIEEKLKCASQQRDDNIKKMLERLKEHEEQIQKVKVQNSTKLQQLDTTITEKLLQAQTRKEQREQEQKEKLKSHEEQVNKVREQKTVKLQQLDSAIQEKLVLAQTRKEQLEQEQKEKLKNHEKRVETVRQNKAAMAANKTTPSSG